MFLPCIVLTLKGLLEVDDGFGNITLVETVSRGLKGLAPVLPLPLGHVFGGYEFLKGIGQVFVRVNFPVGRDFPAREKQGR